MTHLDDYEGNGSEQCYAETLLRSVIGALDRFATERARPALGYKAARDVAAVVMIDTIDKARAWLETRTGTIRCPACARDNVEDGGALTP